MTMSDINTLIANLLKSGNLKSIIVVVISVLLLMAGHVTYKFLIKKIENWKVKKSELTQKDLLNHAMFQNLRTYLNYEIQHLVIGERLREAIFRDFLIFVFTSVKKEFTFFLENGDMEKMSSHLYLTRILECNDNVIKKYEQKAIDEGMPQIILTKFNEWHQCRIDSTYEFLKEVCSDDIFLSNTDKTKVIFDFMVHILNMTIVDAKKTIVNLNGQLDDVVYKGVTSEKKSHKGSC